MATAPIAVTVASAIIILRNIIYLPLCAPVARSWDPFGELDMNRLASPNVPGPSYAATR
jgi:hypothetical protein